MAFNEANKDLIMTTTSLEHSRPNTIKSPGNSFDIGPITRGLVWIAGLSMSVLSIIALYRGLTGLAPDHPNIRSLAILIHVSTVLPAIPMGAYLLLTRKGTALHKQLGKIWVALMVITATSAIFIQSSGSFSLIHIFVPMTLIGSWQIVSSARKGHIQKHKKHIINMYLGALMIPGIVAFSLSGRLMNVWLFW